MIGQVLRWVRDHKSSAAGLVLVAAGCWALVSLSRRVQHMSLKHPAAATAAAAPHGSVAPAASAPAAGDPAGMRGEFEVAANYREFIRWSMARPRDGGEFYALLAWKRCDALRQAGAMTAPGDDAAFHADALRRVEDLRRRCTGVQEAWPALDALYQAARRGGGRDPLLPEDGRGIATPARPDTAEADVDAALRSGDRLVLAEVLRANAGFLDVGNSTGDHGVDRQLREWSAEVVACELAGDCRRGLAVSLHCAGTGDCTRDGWDDVVVARVPESQRIVFDTMLAGLRERAGLPPGRADAGSLS